MSHIFSKLCMRVENDYTNEFPKFQVHKLCWSWDIYIQKCVIFSSWNGYFYIQYLSDQWCNFCFDFDWPIAVCYCIWDRKISLQADDDWQVVVNSSSSQRIYSVNHQVISRLCALSLVLISDIKISVKVWKH